ncbi:hypothetical protein [Sphingomonas psychrolutea]|uniref:Ig-like domain-containing protein n=1 Tax=Sphingomonas psychrolutea TaxID=1259676 RepID=A0ABQ1G1C4_9SPHN|nr:hypothetical protein [Sphingomonas psychrolutea]GGA35569.1 hypothetical protein GCM10011395_02410 [Sphingomonas psychrolutea]
MGLTRFRTLGVLLLPLALLACAKREEDRNLDSLDNELVEAGSGGTNVSDPAMTSALHDQIMVDPALAQQSNADSVRPPAQPYSGGVPPVSIAQTPGGATTGTATSETIKPAPAPASRDCPECQAARDSLTLGALASRQRDKRTSGCAGALRYSARWAERLPVDVPLYPGARVVEAAGADTDVCHLRAVTFSTSAKLQIVLDWYYTRVTTSGYSAEHQSDGTEHTLGGTRDRDGGAYVLSLTGRRDGGTDVDLVANNGG